MKCSFAVQEGSKWINVYNRGVGGVAAFYQTATSENLPAHPNFEWYYADYDALGVNIQTDNTDIIEFQQRTGATDQEARITEAFFDYDQIS